MDDLADNPTDRAFGFARRKATPAFGRPGFNAGRRSGALIPRVLNPPGVDGDHRRCRIPRRCHGRGFAVPPGGITVEDALFPTPEISGPFLRRFGSVDDRMLVSV